MVHPYDEIIMEPLKYFKEFYAIQLKNSTTTYSMILTMGKYFHRKRLSSFSLSCEIIVWFLNHSILYFINIVYGEHVLYL